MELRHLRYFVAVAEALNFTRAAAQLGINQPPLSAQIRQLETELGTQLFRRRARGVELTDAGKLLLEEARVILKQVEKATTGVRRRGRGETGRLILGSSGGVYFHPLIPSIIREYGKRYPDIVLNSLASNTALLVARLRAGQFDAAFIRPPIDDTEGLSVEPLVDEPAVMVLPVGHPLCRSKSAPLSALAQETFVMIGRELNPAYYDAVIMACLAAGFRPRLGPPAPQLLPIIPMVAAGLGVSIVPQSVAGILPGAVVYLPIKGNAPRAMIGLAYQRGDRSAAVRNFIAAARSVMERQGAAVVVKRPGVPGAARKKSSVE
jgi:DNA-binding transcriptional LysR family regulator